MQKMESRKRAREESKGQTVPQFLSKTYDILEDAKHKETISWTDDGSAFAVKKINEFSEKVLPKYFKHNNFASFVRQLNMYGFHKTKHENHDNIFRHELFHRGKKQELKGIKRKTAEPQTQTTQNPEDELCRKKMESLSKELVNLKQNQGQIEARFSMLQESYSEMARQNRLLYQELYKNKESQKKIEKLILFLLNCLNKSGRRQLLSELQRSSLTTSRALTRDEAGLAQEGIVVKDDNIKDLLDILKSMIAEDVNHPGSSNLFNSEDLLRKDNDLPFASHYVSKTPMIEEAGKTPEIEIENLIKPSTADQETFKKLQEDPAALFRTPSYDLESFDHLISPARKKAKPDPEDALQINRLQKSRHDEQRYDVTRFLELRSSHSKELEDIHHKDYDDPSIQFGSDLDIGETTPSHLFLNTEDLLSSKIEEITEGSPNNYKLDFPEDLDPKFQGKLFQAVSSMLTVQKDSFSTRII